MDFRNKTATNFKLGFTSGELDYKSSKQLDKSDYIQNQKMNLRRD